MLGACINKICNFGIKAVADPRYVANMGNVFKWTVIGPIANDSGCKRLADAGKRTEFFCRRGINVYSTVRHGGTILRTGRICKPQYGVEFFADGPRAHAAFRIDRAALTGN